LRVWSIGDMLLCSGNYLGKRSSVFLFMLAAIGSSPNLLLSIEWQIGLGILGLVFLALGIIIWYYQEKNRDRKISDSGSSLPKLPRPSLYDPMYSNEQTRLEIQAKRNRDIDCEAFRVGLTWLQDKKNLVALDIGCANGSMTVDRFSRFDNFIKVFGIDKNISAINQAVKLENSKYCFRNYDVEAQSFRKEICEIGHENGFDFVFMSLVLHHLADPVAVIKDIQEVLKIGGIFVVRSSDDGSKICYPDSNSVLKTVLDISNKVEGTSDRFNGRKLYYYFKSVGFTKITMLYKVHDTIGLTSEEKLEFFEESFSYRLNYLKKKIG
jgi:SAM-dependent methyltransferase